MKHNPRKLNRSLMFSIMAMGLVVTLIALLFLRLSTATRGEHDLPPDSISAPLP